MERKIGEIFEYNGEWYQCVNGFECTKCDLHQNKRCTARYNDIGSCSKNSRKDNTPVIFKKLEKVGVPYEFDGHLFQSYHTFAVPIFTENYVTVREFGNNSKISIEIKENKEDVEEKKPMTEKLKEYLAQTSKEQLEKDLELLKRFNEAGVSVDEFIKSQEKLSLKPFDLEAAKSGKPVCTRDGRKARIICFDVKGNFPIAVAVAELEEDTEIIYTYPLNGRARLKGNQNHSLDLMMLPEKKEGWVNVYREESNNNERLIEQTIYKTRKDAFDNACPKGYITTTKINWEE